MSSNPSIFIIIFINDFYVLTVAFDGAILLGKVNGEEQSELCSANSHEESTKHGL